MSEKHPRNLRLHHRIAHHAKHWFIPHEGNDHKPHALRPGALRAYAYILITAKVVSAIFLFTAFPNQAQFAAYTSSTIISLTNESRSKENLPALKENSLLTLAAQRKANDMLARDYFAHTTPDGKRFWTWVDGTGYNYTLAGENLAIDFTTPESAHEALIASPTHKANIMNNRYKEIGVAVVTGNMDGEETTVLVEMFGTQAAKKTTVAKVTTAKKPTTTTKPTTTKTITTKPTTTTKPVVRAEETPKPSASVYQQSYDNFTAAPSATIDVWAEFRNTGDVPWKTNSLTLVTADPVKHDSKLVDASWESPSIISGLAEEVVSKDVVRFEWKLKSPAIEGSVTEHFALIDTAGTVVPTSTVAFTMNVKTPATVASTSPTPTQTDIANPLPQTTQEPTIQQTTSRPGFVSKIITFIDRFYIGFIFFLLLALGLNIFVKFRIQHAHIIGQTLAVVAIAAAGLLVKFHFLEGIEKVIKVLGS